MKKLRPRNSFKLAALSQLEQRSVQIFKKGSGAVKKTRKLRQKKTQVTKAWRAEGCLAVVIMTEVLFASELSEFFGREVFIPSNCSTNFWSRLMAAPRMRMHEGGVILDASNENATGGASRFVIV